MTAFMGNSGVVAAGGAGAAAYIARAISLSSSNYLTAAASLLADSKLLTFVITLKAPFTNSGRYFYINNSTYGNIFQLDSQDNGLRIRANSETGSRVWEVQSSNLVTGGDVWRTIMCSVDLSSAGSTRQYNGDTDIESTLLTFTNTAMGLAGDGGGSGTPFCGLGYSGTFGTTGFDVADVWIKSGVALDFDVEANRRLFIDSAGKPVDLGGTGVVDGNTPEIYLSLRDGDAVSSYATNKGSAGNFSITGTLTEASTSPSDDPPTGINGVRIHIPSTGWMGFKDLAITLDSSTDDIMDTLTRHTGTSVVTSMATLAAGEYGTNSDYNTDDGGWNDAGWNDGDDTANTAGSVHWTDSDTVDMDIYVKFASAAALRDIRVLIWAPGSYTYTPADWVFYDDAGNVLTPATAPASASDYEHEYDANNKSYKFTF